MSLTFWCPLAMEARAVRRGIAKAARTGGNSAARTGGTSAARRGGTSAATVLRTGMGPDRSRKVAPHSGPVAVVGFGGAVVDNMDICDVVVATEVWAADVAPIKLPGADAVAQSLRNAGFTVHTGPVASVHELVVGAKRRPLAEQGAVAVDMESAWLLRHHGGPAAVVRVMTDTPDRELWSIAAPVRIYRALRTIRRLAPVLAAEPPLMEETV